MDVSSDAENVTLAITVKDLFNYIHEACRQGYESGFKDGFKIVKEEKLNEIN